MKAHTLCAILVYMASPLAAQTFIAAPEHHRMATPARAAEAWAYVQACSGILWPEGLRGIVWTTGPSRPVMADSLHATSDTIVGQWFPPDTVWLAEERVGDPFTLTHELLHHILRTAPFANPHPWEPFQRPCQLAVFQRPWFALPVTAETLAQRAEEFGFPAWGANGTRTGTDGRMR